jgi:hypothetical protein
MDPRIARISPMRSPRWRYERAVELLRGRPQPGPVTWNDDHPIRRAHRMFSELAAAGGNPVRIEQIQCEHLHFWRAHEIWYSTDSLTRHMLEAHLLIKELSYEEIAVKFAATRETIEYFANVYFDVRDRLESSMWIQKVIRGSFDPWRTTAKGGAGNEARGYVLRHLAYSGGQQVLETAITGLSGDRRPESSSEILSWCNDTFTQLVRSAAVTAALTLRVDSKNAIHLIKIALKGSAGGVRGSTGDAGDAELDARLFDCLSKIQAAAHPAKPQGQPSKSVS